MGMLEMFGIGASILALCAFALNQYKILSEDSLLYDLLFLLSSAALLFYAYKTDSLPFMIVNGAWVAVSLLEVFKDLMRKRA